MNYLDILILDDDLGMIDLFETAVEAWNESNVATEKQFKVIVADVIDDARQRRFDCAIVDLRLQNGNQVEDQADNGNSFATSIIYERGIPVAVVSGHIAELSDTLERLDHFKSFSKNDGYGPVVEWLSTQWELMATLKVAREQIELASAEVFSKRLWPQWQATQALSKNSSAKREKIVTRQFASHIADLLGLDLDTNPDWHPFENYVVPALTEARAHTGDIFQQDDGFWIVLSPQCDMAIGKIVNVLLASCTEGIEGWGSHIETLKKTPDRVKSRDFVKKFVDQDIAKSKHFLPPFPGRNEPVLVSFSNVKTSTLDDLNSVLDQRIGSVSTPFLGNLIQRFGAFISRTGQPNIDISHFYEG